MDNIQCHADAGEAGEVITASIITKEVAFSSTFTAENSKSTSTHLSKVRDTANCSRPQNWPIQAINDHRSRRR